MAEDDDPARPRSLTLMAGPIDARINPTAVNELATQQADRVVRAQRDRHRARARFAGAGRRVYPGFLQLAAFMSMNLERHARRFREPVRDLVAGDDERAERDEGLLRRVLRRARPGGRVLPRDGAARLPGARARARRARRWRGRPVDPAAIRRTALLTVEGERDDICAVGQTARGARPLHQVSRRYAQRHHLQAGVGHYGVFSGRRWEREIYPEISSHILKAR